MDQPTAIAGKNHFPLLRHLKYCFHSLWIFFPGILFLLLTAVCFWNLGQGKDLMVLATEHKGFFLQFLCCLSFLVLVAWYSARNLGDAKQNSPLTPPDYLPPGYYKHLPRLLGFTFFTVLLLAFAQTLLFKKIILFKSWESGFYILLFLLSFPYYFVLVKWMEKKFVNISFNRLFWTGVTVLALMILLISLNIRQFKWMVFPVMLMLQAGFMIMVVTRRVFLDRVRFNDQPTLAEKFFSRAFIVLVAAMLLLYLACTFSIRAAVQVGSFSFVLLAFAIFLGLGFQLSKWSVKAGFNVHFIILLVVFVFGFWTERHRVHLVKKPDAVHRNYDHKASLGAYFTKWVTDRAPDIARADSFPVYFVLSDGGASRSGYWVASVLGSLEDTTHGTFSRHLFVLSGASGGSVGNGTFYLLLRHRDSLKNQSLLDAARDYLKTDFLSYTLSRMLGHDFFVQLCPFDTRGDRARALTQAMEYAPGTSVFLKGKMDVPFSDLAVFEDSISTRLPVLCINTTRMQDGLPSVISTIDIDATFFNNRLDVTDKIAPDRDIKLSSAIVLGASFPYLSPAGRIDEFSEQKADSLTRVHYFVDGGYVDNSGAGVVHEMLIRMEQLRQAMIASGSDTLYRKLRFHVLHISNSPYGNPLLTRTNPFINDLAAPIKTMVGSYSIQTTINDSRLKNFLFDLYSDNNHYTPINLYAPRDSMDYSMNWVISQHTLDSMNKRLASAQVQAILGGIRREMK